MEKVERISIEDFMSMFVAVGYLQEQRLFNVNSLKNYLRTNYGINDEIANEVDLIVDKMAESGMINKVDNFDGLYRIGNSIPFERIISNNYEYADVMRNFFYNYVNSSLQNPSLISERSEVLTKQKK